MQAGSPTCGITRHLTICAIPKPFRGTIAAIQENALASWTTLYPHPRIVLAGDEEGVAAAARRFGAQHVPDVKRNTYGTPLLPCVVTVGEKAAKGGTVCFVNADIMLFQDFQDALSTVGDRFDRYLMAGRGWCLDPPGRIGDGGTTLAAVRREAHEAGDLRSSVSSEYFAFTPGLFGEIPPFALGRSGYDPWLLWRARTRGAPVIDATRDVVAVHQEHDYNHIDGGSTAAHTGPEAQRNRELRAGRTHVDSLLRDARYRLSGGRLRRNPLSIGALHHRVVMAKRTRWPPTIRR